MALSTAASAAVAAAIGRGLPAAESVLCGPWPGRVFIHRTATTSASTDATLSGWEAAAVGVAALIMDRAHKTVHLRVYDAAAAAGRGEVALGAGGADTLLTAELYYDLRLTLLRRTFLSLELDDAVCGLQFAEEADAKAFADKLEVFRPRQAASLVPLPAAAVAVAGAASTGLPPLAGGGSGGRRASGSSTGAGGDAAAASGRQVAASAAHCWGDWARGLVAGAAAAMAVAVAAAVVAAAVAAVERLWCQAWWRGRCDMRDTSG